MPLHGAKVNCVILISPQNASNRPRSTDPSFSLPPIFVCSTFHFHTRPCTIEDCAWRKRTGPGTHGGRRYTPPRGKRMSWERGSHAPVHRRGLSAINVKWGGCCCQGLRRRPLSATAERGFDRPGRLDPAHFISSCVPRTILDQLRNWANVGLRDVVATAAST